MKNIKKVILKIAVSVGLIIFVLSKIDIQKLALNFRDLNYTHVLLAVILVSLNWFVGAIRWKLLLIGEGAKNVSLAYLTRLYFIGSFFNNFMPTSVGGDVYKIYRLGKKISSNTKAFSATFMERFTGVVALVLISYFGLVKSLDFWLGLVPEAYAGLFEVLLFAGFWAAAVAGFLSLRILGKKFDFFKKVHDSLWVYKDHKNILLSAFLTSFIVQLCVIFAQYFVFRALGIEIPVLHALFAFPVINLASFFVPSLNGIGVQDALYVYFFANLGLTSELALSGSLLFHLARLFVSLFGGEESALGLGRSG